MNEPTARTLGRWSIAIGPIAAVLVAWATSTVDDATSIANAALALAIVCVATALVNPAAGFVTSAVAALALNYFHTEPVHSLRMSEPGEIATVVLLVVLGAAVSVATTMRVRSKVSTHRTVESLAAAMQLRRSLERGDVLPSLWQAAILASCRQAGSIDVRLVDHPPADMPLIGQNLTGSDPDRGIVLVPERGAALLLAKHGALILTPQPGMGAVEATRTILMQFAEQVDAALSLEDEGRRAA